MQTSWRILEPIHIGKAICKNRVVIAAHSYGYVDTEGLPTNDLVAYVAERSKGGVGMMMLGGTCVSSKETALEGSYLSLDNRIVPWYQKIARAVHKNNTLILEQLMHAGAYLDPSEGAIVLAPSPIPQEITCSIPIQLTIDEIKGLIDDFANAAQRCKEGGLDGVEVKCDQGLLIHQFLSPFFNRRDDDYGGNYEKRFRFLKEVLIAVRESVGAELILGVRISGDSLTIGDLGLDDGVQIGRDLSQLGLIDYIHVNGATNATFRGYYQNHGDNSISLANFASIAREIKSVVDLPVILASMIQSVHDAEHVIQSGIADLVAMTRAHIAEPEIVKKLEEDRIEDIRPCVLANQGCIGNHWKGKGVHCIHNAAAGRERELGSATLKKSKISKKILVIGGGVAGLEFSRIAATRGHVIELFEKEKEFGGQILLAGRMPYRHSFKDIVEYLELQVKKLKVSMYKGVDVDAEELISIRSEYDLIVLATGAYPYIPPIYNEVEPAKSFTIENMVQREKELGENVIVVDIDWRQNALSVAEWLVQRNHRVTILSPSFGIGTNLDVVTRTSYYSRLSGSAKFIPLTNIVSLHGHTAIIRNVLTTGIDEVYPVDSVVFVTGSQPITALYDSVKSKIDNVVRIGDCVYPRGIPEAFLDANRLARKI